MLTFNQAIEEIIGRSANERGHAFYSGSERPRGMNLADAARFLLIVYPDCGFSFEMIRRRLEKGEFALYSAILKDPRGADEKLF